MTRARRAVPIHVPSRQKTENLAALSREAPPPPTLLQRWRAAPPPEPGSSPLTRALVQASSFARPIGGALAPRPEATPDPTPAPRPVGPMLAVLQTYEHAALVNPLTRAWRRMAFWLRRLIRA